MKRQSLYFLFAFLPSAVLVMLFVYAAQPLYGVAVGVAGLLVHAVLSRGGNHEGEVADSSYFFGFLLTLVFLVVGLYRVGVEARAGGGVNILVFLEDIAAGLALTVFGLLIRQVRTLAAAPLQEGPGTNELMARLASNIETMTELWRSRPEQQVLDVLQQSRNAAREAADQLDRSLATASERIAVSVTRLEEATTTATQSMTRAASGVSNSIVEVTERLEVEVQQVMTIVQQARAQHEQQLELWKTSLEAARGGLAQAQTGLDTEYQRIMTQFAASSTAFAQLAERTTLHVESLPNPADRLAGLWDGVQQLEADLTQAIAGSVMQLGVLRERAQQLGASFDQLGGSTDRAATAIGTGGARMADSLSRELEQMNEIIEQYVRLLEKTERSLRVRV